MVMYVIFQVDLKSQQILDLLASPHRFNLANKKRITTNQNLQVWKSS